jgi:putative endonuclease
MCHDRLARRSQRSERSPKDPRLSAELGEQEDGITLLSHTSMSNAKRFVYILKSIDNPAAYYVGLTSDVETRLATHNAGLSPHTAANRPWRRLVVVEFDEQEPAVLFEKYLKTGSGREFARRHFRQENSDRSES